MESDYQYPVKLSFGYQQRVLAVDIPINNKIDHNHYRKYLAKKYKLPIKKILEWSDD
jgi:hypothetical protein